MQTIYVLRVQQEMITGTTYREYRLRDPREIKSIMESLNSEFATVETFEYDAELDMLTERGYKRKIFHERH